MSTKVGIWPRFDFLARSLAILDIVFKLTFERVEKMGVPKAMENLLFVEDGKFHSFIKKSQKSIDLKAFESLPSIEDKIIFLTKNGIEYKPVEKTVSETKSESF